MRHYACHRGADITGDPCHNLAVRLDTRCRPLLVATLVMASAVLTVPTRPASAAHVIEPTMERVVRQLARVPAGAPAGTKPAGASLARDHVAVRFSLPDTPAPAVFELHHPGVAQPGDLTAGPFAIRSTLAADHALTTAFVAAATAAGPSFRWALASESGSASPLDVARARLVMMDVAAVSAGVKAAVAASPGDIAVLRQGAALLTAAKQPAEAASLVAKARQLLSAAPTPQPPRAAAELLALDVLASAPDAPRFEALLEALLDAAGGACAAAVVADTLDITGRSDAALSVADRVLAKDPACRDAHRIGAEIVGRNKDWQALHDRAAAAAKRFPDDPGFDVRRATALRGLGRFEEARDVLEVAVRADPHSAGSMSSLAALYTLTRTNETAYQHLVKRCDARPDDLVSCFLAGVLAHYLAHHKDCVARMGALMDALPGQPRVPMYAAISAFFDDQPAEADRLIDAAVAISGAMDPDVFYCRSIIRRDRDLPGAIKDLERFLEVAHRGWHSQGKISRVTHELEQLRSGKLPTPAEAHHRRELDAKPGDAKPAESPTQPAAPSTAAPSDAPAGEPAAGCGGGPISPLPVLAAVLLLALPSRRGRTTAAR